MKKYLLFLTLIFIISGCGNNNIEYQKKIDKFLETSEICVITTSLVTDEYPKVWNKSIKGDLTSEDFGSMLNTSEMSFKGYLTENNFDTSVFGTVVYKGCFSKTLNITKGYLDTEYKGNLLTGIKKQSEKMKNPPKQYEDTYKEMLSLYKSVEKCNEMALNPSCSLLTFNEKKNELSSDITSKYKEIDIILPSKK